jgi:RNA polymerase sporulation-specific sigma factor
MYENTTEEILQAQGNDEKALEKIVEKNSGLIWSIVKRFTGRGYEIEDLYQIGCIGFIKAVKRFDATFEVKISTYAVPYILGEIKRFLRDDGPIKVSRSIKELAYKIKEVNNNYLSKHGEEMTINQLSEILKMSKEEIAVALDYTKPLESINEDVYDENGMTKIETIKTEKDEALAIINKIALKQLIENLELKEKEIIILRYFKDKTQMQVAKILGISQVQVSRIEKRILASMREKLIS